MQIKPVVIKIGGSTLGQHDTTIEDLVELQKRKMPLVVVHGGGKTVTDWSNKLGIPTKFVNGLRVTDLATLKVVTAVLGGLVNKELVSAIWHLGGRAVGLSGVDGNIIQAKNKNPELGYTGEELKVNVSLILELIKDGYIPIIAPVCSGLFTLLSNESNLINVNGDTAAAEIAASLQAERLIFLTDVPGLYDDCGNIIKSITTGKAYELINSGVISGGMTAKINACLNVLEKVNTTRIIDGRISHALRIEMENNGGGTTIAG